MGNLKLKQKDIRNDSVEVLVAADRSGKAFPKLLGIHDSTKIYRTIILLPFSVLSFAPVTVISLLEKCEFIFPEMGAFPFSKFISAIMWSVEMQLL